MPMTCFFFASVCRFLMPAWPSRRCHRQPFEAFASKHTAGCGPVEKSTMYKSPLLKPSKTDFCLCQRRWYASDVTVLMEHPSIDSCHQSCDLYIHYRGPTHLLWVAHPADELAQLTNSYTSSVKNMTSVSSVQFHQAIAQISSMRTCEMKVHFIMISLRPFRHFVRSPANSSDVRAHLETWPCRRD